MTDLAPYGGLFLHAFLAATILPLPSEAALVALLAAGFGDPVVLVAVASVGNVLGSIVNWWLGRNAVRLRDRKWFPIGAAQLDRAQAWFGRWGLWSLLLAWVPVVGDPLTLVAGALGVRFAPFLLLIAIGKTARYVVVAAGVLELS